MMTPPVRSGESGIQYLKNRITRGRVVISLLVALIVWITALLAANIVLASASSSFSWPRFYCSQVLGFIGKVAFVFWFLSSGLWLIREAGAWPASRDRSMWRLWSLSVLLSAVLLWLGFMVFASVRAAEIH